MAWHHPSQRQRLVYVFAEGAGLTEEDIDYLKHSVQRSAVFNLFTGAHNHQVTVHAAPAAGREQIHEDDTRRGG